MSQAHITVDRSVVRSTAVSPILLHATAAVLGSLLVAICAHVSVPLLFTPVPLTLQTFAVLLLGLTLGPAAAFAALTLYLVEGAAGLPVFSPHGPGGLVQLIGPTGGYLISYPFAAVLTGLIAKRLRPASFASNAVAAAMGSLVILTLGASWLMVTGHLSPGTALKMAVSPFLPGDALKVCASAAVALGIFQVRRRLGVSCAGMDDRGTH